MNSKTSQLSQARRDRQMYKRLYEEQLGKTQQAKKKVLDDKIIEHQFACLESWCASRHNGKGDYCQNCKNLNELKERHLKK